MGIRFQFVFPLALSLAGLAIEIHFVQRWLAKQTRSPRARAAAWSLFALTAMWIGGAVFLGLEGVAHAVPGWWAAWWEGSALAFCACLMAIGGLVWARNTVAGLAFRPERRLFLESSTAVLCLAPVAATTFGIVRRNQFHLREIDIPIPNLPKDLNGLRIVQVSDIHMSPFLSEAECARAIDMANETRAHLALMTGDLISRRRDPLDACLRQIGRLRADAGVIGCLGNHEVFAHCEDYVTREAARLGVDFLRKESRQIRFGGSAINFVGVDYQPQHKPYLVGTEKLLVPGQLNVLLSHNPDVFSLAARQGFDLTVSGHTHGGQVNVEILHHNMNLARYFTPYVNGLYRQGKSSVFVTTGLGTIGIPIRLGAAPEVALIRLCAT